MRNYKLALIGFGNVAQALVELLDARRSLLAQRYGVSFSITAVATGRRGCAVDPAGLDGGELLARVRRGESLAPLSARAVPDAFAVIEHSGADAMLENTPVNHTSGEPAVAHCRAALEAGMHAITANKGALVHGYRALRELARARDRRFLFEATVLGGSPLFSVFRKSLPALHLHSFRGVLNATTNAVLTRMERGESLESAVRYCQSVGVAETDPSADLEGWDAAIKVAALCAVLMDVPLTPDEVERTGIGGITPELIAQAAAQGRRWKLVCSAQRVGAGVKARVAPEALPASDPLYGLEGSSNAATFRSDLLGDYTVVEAEREGLIAGPGPTAYSLFADLLDALGAQPLEGV